MHELVTRRRLVKIKHDVEGLLGRQELPVSVKPADFRYAFYRGQDGKGRYLFTLYGKAMAKDGAEHELHGHVVRLDLACCNVFSEVACTKAAVPPPAKQEATGSAAVPSDPPASEKGTGDNLMKISAKKAEAIKGIPTWVHKIKEAIDGLPEELTEALDTLHDWAEETMKAPEVQKAMEELPVEKPATEGRKVEKRDDGSMEIYMPFTKVDDEQRTVHGIVYEPDVIDAQGDWATSDEIRKACHGYMLNSRRTGLMHKDDITEKAPLVENYIAPTDMVIGNQRIRKGTWIMAHKIHDDGIWKDIKEGRLTGLSMSGKAVAAAE